MAETRYLTRRGSRWYFQLRVPDMHRAAVGKAVIKESLGTDSLSEARQLRWAKLAYWTERFGSPTLTDVEIEQLAQNEFHAEVSRTLQAWSKGDQDFWQDPSRHDKEFHGGGISVGLDFAIKESVSESDRSVSDWAADKAKSLLSQKGVSLDGARPSFDALSAALKRAKIEAWKSLLAQREYQVYQPPKALHFLALDPSTGVSRAPKRPSQSGTPFSEVASRYVAERIRDASVAWTHQTRSQNETTYRLFTDFLSDAPLASVTNREAAEFLDTIAKLRKGWGKAKAEKGLTLWQLLERASGPPGMSNKTINRHASALSGLFRWAKRRGEYEGPNPFADLSRPKGKATARKWLPFEPDELTRIFHSPIFTEPTYQERVRPSEFTMRGTIAWASLIALFTGMRQEEVCQLWTDDVREEGDVSYFRVSEDSNRDQSVKTEAGLRTVPVHSALIRSGLLDYVSFLGEKGEARLFPRLKPVGPDKKLGAYFSRRFTEFRRSIGVTNERRVFHSFRATVSTALERAGVPQNEAAQIVGHEKQGMTYGYYSEGLTIIGLSKTVEEIKYPGLDLAHLHG